MEYLFLWYNKVTRVIFDSKFAVYTDRVIKTPHEVRTAEVIGPANLYNKQLLYESPKSRLEY